MYDVDFTGITHGIWNYPLSNLPHYFYSVKFMKYLVVIQAKVYNVISVHLSTDMSLLSLSKIDKI